MSKSLGIQSSSPNLWSNIKPYSLVIHHMKIAYLKVLSSTPVATSSSSTSMTNANIDGLNPDPWCSHYVKRFCLLTAVTFDSLMLIIVQSYLYPTTDPGLHIAYDMLEHFPQQKSWCVQHSWTCYMHTPVSNTHKCSI